MVTYSQREKNKQLAVHLIYFENFTTSTEREENCFLFNIWLLANEKRMFTLGWSDARQFTKAARTSDSIFKWSPVEVQVIYIKQ
jgi:hypothetical protein